MIAVVHHRGQRTGNLAQRVLPHDDERHAGRTDVLLRAAVDHRVLAHVDRTAQNVGTHIGDQRNRRIDVGVVLRAVNRIVGGNVQIIQIRRDGVSFRNIGEVLVFRGSEHLDLAEQFGLFDRLLGPYARIDVTGFLFEKIVGHFEKLGAGAAAQEKNFVVVGNMQQFAEKRLGFVVHGFEIFRPVRYFQQRQPDAFEVQNSLGGILDGYARQNRRSCVEIVFFHRRKRNYTVNTLKESGITASNLPKNLRTAKDFPVFIQQPETVHFF